MKTTSLLPLLITLIAALGVTGCGRADGASAADGSDPGAVVRQVPPVPVRVVPLRQDAGALPVRVSGVLSRREEARLAFKTGGLVAEVTVRVGDAVVAGQVLARLQTAEIDAQAAQARSALAKAQRDLARLERLAAEAVATTENLQDARTAAEVAQAQVNIAAFNQRHAVIVAPAAGRILGRLVEPAEWVGPGQPVLVYAADEAGWLLRGGVADREAAGLAPGDAARVVWSGREVMGTLLQVGEALEPRTGMVPVEIALPAVPVGARSGSAAEGWIAPRGGVGLLRVPASALSEGADRRASLYVLAPDDATVRRQEVTMARLDGAEVLLVAGPGLEPGARIVVAGGEYLADGAPVRVVQR